MLLETNYRERIHMVTNEVKRRLDYQIALQNLHRRMEQEHMVNWVEKSVVGSITPQQVSVLVRLSYCFYECTHHWDGNHLFDTSHRQVKNTKVSLHISVVFFILRNKN